MAWIAALVILLLGALVVPPLWYLLRGSMTGSDAPDTGPHVTLGHFAAVLGNPQFLATGVNTFFFAAGSAVVALLLGWLSAWIVERTNAPLKAVAYFTAIISLGTPYVLYVSAWLLLFGKGGPVNQVYRAVTGMPDVAISIYSLPGMILVEGFLWSPLAFLLVGATLRNANAELEEAARMSGAGVWDTIRRVTLRLSFPSIMALAMLVFIRAIESFEVPALVGLPGRVYVMTTDIYRSMTTLPLDLGGASAFSVVMLLLVLVLLSIYARLSRHSEKYATITGKGFRPRPFDLGRLRYAAAAILVVNFLLLLVLPIGMLVWASLLPFYQPISGAAIKLVTLANYRNVLSSNSLSLVVNTLVVSAATATIAMSLTMVAAWLAVRRGPGAWAIERLATIPLVFPGLVLGIAVMEFFLNVPIHIYGTLWILVWAFVINYLPYGMRYSTAGIIQIHRELEEAAAIFGASPLSRLHRIIVPLLAPALLAGWLFIFLMAARVLSLAILLAGPNSQTMAVAMFDLWTNGQGTELAAFGFLWTMVMAAVAMVFHLLARRSAGTPSDA